MITGGVGGANTQTGARFEFDTDLTTFISRQTNYRVEVIKKNARHNVFYCDELVGQILIKFGLYDFLKEEGVDWRKILSKRLLPDDSIFVILKNKIYIIETKYQEVAGSVDEKPQTCDFKRKQYQRLFAPLNIDVEYIYLFNDWFLKDEYRDMLNYIISVGCSYHFNYIPLEKLGLPVSD